MFYIKTVVIALIIILIGFMLNIPGTIALAGVVIGFILNMAKDHFDNEEKLSFYFNLIGDDSLVDPSQMTKTSQSQYVITLYNYGRVPIILENLTLCNKKRWCCDFNLLIDSIIYSHTTINPHQVMDVRISHQNYDTLKSYVLCNKLEHCTVIATTLRNKEIKGKLDLTIISSIDSLSPHKNI